ncbi:FUSC family protein [Rhodococcus rhodochrous]|uniref:FUSC family protein n=1 Tax=Rhodococcus rhodochrous TaxID=1829 RepID=UPI001D00EF3D|nr:FUSC family protein [Rhodococcus rhodochrous]
MSTMDVTRDQATAELDEVAARLRLNNRALLRVVARAHKAGMRQRAIEQHLDISQATVHRLLRHSAENSPGARADPGRDHRPAHRRADQHRTDDGQLLSWAFTFGTVPKADRVATDACEPGSWDDVERAFYRGQLTEDELVRRDRDRRPNTRSRS